MPGKHRRKTDRPYRRTTQAELDQIARLWTDGHSGGQIATRLAMRTRQVEDLVAKLVRQGVVQRRGSTGNANPRSDQALAEAARRLRDKGFADSTIRTRLALTETRLCRVLAILDAEDDAQAMVAAPGGGAGDPPTCAPPPEIADPALRRAVASLLQNPRGPRCPHEALKQAMAFRSRHASNVPQEARR
jgi:DNA-binding MarR family transcriptional regulator